MKVWFITLPLCFAMSGAMADSIDRAETEGKADAAAASAKAPAHYRMANNKPKRLPGGDVRHCLDLKTSAEIIRCSETRRKK